ncbi:MAG: Transcriptional regulator, LuxR family [Anaerolineae bacterium]|nr:MAG: Transcriptional regulator, LuxR family [Anaerolineae bacterium]
MKLLGESTLRLSLLGGFEVRVGEQSITQFDSDKARALLAYLVMEGDRAHRRQTLSYLFWSDYPEAQALKNLRQTLYRLTQAFAASLPDGVTLLQITPQDVRLNPQLVIDSDYHRFRQLLGEANAHLHRRLTLCPLCLQKLDQAVALFRGNLLSGLSLHGSAAFEDWLFERREELVDQTLNALTALTQAAGRRGDHLAVRRYAYKQIHLSAIDETAYRELMRSLAQDGQRNAALAHYKTLKRQLRSELGIEPMAETTALYNSLVQEEPLGVQAAAPLRHFPTILTSFLGRQAELDMLLDALAAGSGRLVTLCGPGGVGKTRLALEAAQVIGPLFENGAAFLNLQALQTPEQVMISLAETMNLPLQRQANRSLRSQVLTGIQHAGEFLLILDNCEHLPLAEFIAELLQAAPQLVILATSRARLGLQAERVLLVQGLPYPQSETANPAESVAVQLFLQRAASFAMEWQELAPVARICALLEGLPLGIELAAACSAHTPLDQIATAIEQNLDALDSTYPDVVERQRSLRAVFEHSWKLLDKEEQAALMQLAIFKGGFQIEAAQFVGAIHERTLKSLWQKSLLAFEAAAGRYTMHPTLQYFAAEKLRAVPLTASLAQIRHASYFATFVSQRAQPLRTLQQQQVQKEIGRELQNILAAWEWATDHQDLSLMRQLMQGLYLYYEAKSWFEEGMRIFQQGIRALRSLKVLDASAMALLAALLGRQAVFYRQLSQYRRAEEAVKEGCALLEGHELSEEKAFLLHQKAWIAFLQARYHQASEWAEQSLQGYQRLENPMGIGDALVLLGWTAYELGYYPQAAALCERARTVCEAVDYAWGSQYALYGLGLVKRAQGDSAAARQLFEENYQFCEQMDFVWGAALALINLGLVALVGGDVPEAAQAFQQSLQICERIGSKWGVAQSYKGLGYVALEQKAYPSARYHAEQSLKLYRQMADHDGMADCYLILCQAACETHQTRQAWGYLKKAEDAIQHSENGFREARTFYHRARIYQVEGEQDLAEAWFLKTLAHPACEGWFAQKAQAEIQKGL